MVNISFVSRSEWNAMPPKSVERMTHPIEHVNYSVCNLTDPCRTREECSKCVKEIQNHFSDMGLPDITYSFLIGNDGYVYEGLGWDYKPGPGIQRYEELRDKAIDIAVIGGHSETNDESTEMLAFAFKKAKELVRYGVEKKLIIENYKRHGLPEDLMNISSAETRAKERNEPMKIEAENEY